MYLKGDIMVDFIISPIARGIGAIFNLIFNVVGNYGLSLIILSIVVWNGNPFMDICYKVI